MKESRMLKELLRRMRDHESDRGYDPNVTIRLMSKETWYEVGSQNGQLNKGGMYSLYYNERTDEFMLVEDGSNRFIYEYQEYVNDQVFSKLLEQFIIVGKLLERVIIVENRNYYSYLKLRNGEQENAISNKTISFIESSLSHTEIVKTWKDSQTEDVNLQVLICSSNKDDLSLLSDFLQDTIKPFHVRWRSMDRELDEILEFDVDIMEFDLG